MGGGPLTDFRRGRRNLPLPLERVKIAAPLGSCIRARVLVREVSTGGPLTECRGRPNLPLPSERVKSGGRGSALELRWAVHALMGLQARLAGMGLNGLSGNRGRGGVEREWAMEPGGRERWGWTI